jgi:hypothetical protein
MTTQESITMDYKTIAFAVTNGDYSHDSIALAIRALEILDCPAKTIDEIDDMLYRLRPASTADEA